MILSLQILVCAVGALAIVEYIYSKDRTWGENS